MEDALDFLTQNRPRELADDEGCLILLRQRFHKGGSAPQDRLRRSLDLLSEFLWFQNMGVTAPQLKTQR